jgi:hypothetical protein
MDLETRGEERIRVGHPHVHPSTPSHVPGVREGNHRASVVRNPGIVARPGLHARGTARRSTGINPDARNPIDPRSPNLSPA